MAEEPPKFPITRLQEDIGAADGEPLPIQQWRTLTDVAVEHVLFTPAILYTHANLDRDLMIDFTRANRLSRDEAPFAINCPFLLFQHLGISIVNDQVVNWDQRLYALIRSRWAQFAGFVRTIGIVNRRAGFYARVGSYQLNIVDPTVLHSGRVLSDLPVITLEIFMASSNRGIHYICPADDPPRTQSYPKTDPADAAVLQEARAVFHPLAANAASG